MAKTTKIELTEKQERRISGEAGYIGNKPTQARAPAGLKEDPPIYDEVPEGYR